VYKTLKRKGIKTFADLRGGRTDRTNPNGYKVRMTAVDANRGRIVVLRTIFPITALIRIGLRLQKQ